MLHKVDAGDEIMIEATAKVLRRSTREEKKDGQAEPKKTTTIEIQFTHMGMAPKGAYSEAFKEATKGKT